MGRGYEGKPGWRGCDPPTHRDLRAGVRLALTLAEHDDVKELIGPLLEPAAADLVSDAALDAWLLRQVTTYSHICGTCKMGPGTDPMGARPH
jgi:choline dehydrogenase-like flavoprotein